MRKRYWYVKCGDHLRMAEGENATKACIDAFGCILRGVTAKDLGTRHPRYFSQKKKLQLQTEKEGWIPV